MDRAIDAFLLTQSTSLVTRVQDVSMIFMFSFTDGTAIDPANLHGHVLKAFSDVVASNALNNRILRRQAKWPTEMVRLFIRPNPAKHKLQAPDSRIPPPTIGYHLCQRLSQDSVTKNPPQTRQTRHYHFLCIGCGLLAWERQNYEPPALRYRKPWRS